MCRALFQAPGMLSDREKSLPLWSLRSGGTPLFVSLGTGLQAPADQTRPHSPAPGELISAASIQKPFSQDPALGAHRSLTLCPSTCFHSYVLKRTEDTCSHTHKNCHWKYVLRPTNSDKTLNNFIFLYI